MGAAFEHPALNPASFSRWALHDKAAQRRLSVFFDCAFQPHFDHMQGTPIYDASCQRLHQFCVRNARSCPRDWR